MANIILSEEYKQALREKAAGYARSRDEALANANLNEGARIAIEALLNPTPEVPAMEPQQGAREGHNAN